MIHTFKLYFPINYNEVQNIQHRFDIQYKQLNDDFRRRYPLLTKGINISISNSGNGKWKLYMVVDAIKLLGNAVITEHDYNIIEKTLKMILLYLLGHSSHFNNHILLRVDFRFDVKVEDKNVRELIMHMYKKLTSSYRFQKKFLGNSVNEVFTPYKTTVYHSSKSIESMVYLKEEERIAKCKVIEEYEKDVIRYEVHLKENHLYDMENRIKTTNRPRKLQEYMKEEVFIEYFHKYIAHIYHHGDFFKVDEARKILKNSNLKNTDKIKLIDLLIQISRHSIDTPIKTKTVSKGTFKKRLQLLSEVNINPILIPKNFILNVPSIVQNPLKYFPWAR